MKKLLCPKFQDEVSYQKTMNLWHIECPYCNSKLNFGKSAKIVILLAYFFLGTIFFLIFFSDNALFEIKNILFQLLILVPLVWIVVPYQVSILIRAFGIELKLKE